MSFGDELKNLLGTEERNTVSGAFGGPKTPGRTPSFSVPKITNWILSKRPFGADSSVESALGRASDVMPDRLFRSAISSAVRFSFLIELTNLEVGSTKMKTRWVPGFILMSQEGSFEPIRGTFQPGSDPRAAPFEDCLAVFERGLTITSAKISSDASLENTILTLDKYHSVSYEFPCAYADPNLVPAHNQANVVWILNSDLLWLLKARKILNRRIDNKLRSKIRTKTYLTDRSQTGKDQTNRAKRWEVLADDFQHATLTECWSVERKLLEDLVCFESFTPELKDEFITEGLVKRDQPTTRCPVTRQALDYGVLESSPVIGVAEYQVGHLHPLKKGGRHTGENICWQSADGNRIQGDLTIEETIELIEGIAQRLAAEKSKKCPLLRRRKA